LKLPAGKLSELAEHQRAEEFKKELSEPPAPLLKEVRELVLRKCVPERRSEIHTIFERQPFGELERLVTQKLLDVVQKVAKQELESESWLKLVAQLSGRSYEEMRVSILEFLDTDVFNVSGEHCISYLDPLIDSWDINLANFGMEVVLNRRLAPAHIKKVEFVETEAGALEEETGLRQFLRDPSMSGDATKAEIEFLEELRFKGPRPTALYYYRELQNLRDPLNFREASAAPLQKSEHANAVEKQIQLHAKEGAMKRWTENKARRSPKRRKSKVAP
jgi:hypothetical protein